MHRDHSFTSTNHWQNAGGIDAVAYECGYCSSAVGSGLGWNTDGGTPARIRVCPNCNGPTFFSTDSKQWPGAKVGKSVSSLPEDVGFVFEEARESVAGNAFTGAVMLCRKILMHVAVEKGAKPNRSFQKYVEWLVKEHYVPKGADAWLDYVRKRGNDANHEIIVMTKETRTAFCDLRKLSCGEYTSFLLSFRLCRPKALTKPLRKRKSPRLKGNDA